MNTRALIPLRTCFSPMLGAFLITSALAWVVAWPSLLHADTSAENQALYQAGLNAYQDKDYATAREKWLQAAELGNPQAMFNLGTLYANGEGVSGDAEQALNYFRRAADAGLAAAQHNLALAYYQGKGVERSIPRAKTWWQRAAEQNHPQAQFNLGVLLWKGEEVAHDETEALKWFRKASSAGHQNAQQFLDDLFEKVSFSVPAEEKPAEKTQKTSENPEQSTPASQTPYFQLGKRAFDEEKYDTALENWLQASHQGNRGAQYYIAYLYENGLGVKENPRKALEWFQKAANNGQAQAQYQLAQFYLSGTGVEKNESLGLFWMQSAADNNDLRARDYMQQQR